MLFKVVLTLHLLSYYERSVLIMKTFLSSLRLCAIVIPAVALQFLYMATADLAALLAVRVASFKSFFQKTRYRP